MIRARFGVPWVSYWRRIVRPSRRPGFNMDEERAAAINRALEDAMFRSLILHRLCLPFRSKHCTTSGEFRNSRRFAAQPSWAHKNQDFLFPLSLTVCAEPEQQGLDQQGLYVKGPKPYLCSYLANFVFICFVLSFFVFICLFLFLFVFICLYLFLFVFYL